MLALIEADPPLLTEEIESQVAKVEELILKDPDKYFIGTTQYATVTMSHVEVNPRPGARILPATSILIRPDEIIGEHLDFPALDDDAP